MLVRRSLALVAAGALPVALLAQTPQTRAADGAAAPVAAAAAAGSVSFERTATYPVFQNVPAGVDPAAETVAEISAVSEDGRTLVYTDAAGQRIGFLDLTDPANPVGAGTLDLRAIGDADDQPTSVAVVGDYVLVVIDETGGDLTAPRGRLDVVRLADRTVVRSIDLGGQPDSIAISPDKTYAAIAMENQRDENATPAGGAKGDLPQLPAGFVQVVELGGAPGGWAADPLALPASALTGMDTPQDAEPEYVDINAANQLALTLQENNGVVVIDLPTRAIVSAFSAGSPTIAGIDVTSDGIFNATATIAKPREPDSIQWVGPGLIATANEGDWKGGSRGWTVFDAATGAVRWDAGTSFEELAVKHGLFNDARAKNKGAEPEGLAFETFGGVPYAFVGSERSNFVAVYDMTTPTAPALVQVLPATNGPEGLLPVPSRNLFITSSETDSAAVGVRATVGVYRLGAGTAAFPSLVSKPATGSSAPIGWGALGALSADPGTPTRLWAASDSAYKTARIYSVDVSAAPAVIDRVIEVTDPTGAKPALDIEGIAARPGGGFWLAIEGTTGAGNKLVRTDAAGVIRQEVPLPADVAAHVKNWGFEGVSVTGAGTADSPEQLVVALQRTLWVDPSVAAASLVPLEGNNARIGRYDVATGAWTWFLYPLETTATAGDWLGLSEVTAVDADTVAVIERDKLNGPAARVKRVYTVDLPAGSATAATPVTKRLAVDVLPTLRGLHGWTQEKLEGLTVGADNAVYAVTDNDGLKDATGETQLLRLGALTSVFAGSLASTTSVALDRTTAEADDTVTARVTVAAPGAGAALRGTVVLRGGGRTLGTATPGADGTATVSFVPGAVGPLSVQASWSGTATRLGSSSQVVALDVTRAATSTTLAARRKARANDGPASRPVAKVRLVARVAPDATGTVVFTDRGRRLGRATVQDGIARLTVRLRVGRHRVLAAYTGGVVWDGSRSDVRVVRVLPRR